MIIVLMCWTAQTMAQTPATPKASPVKIVHADSVRQVLQDSVSRLAKKKVAAIASQAGQPLRSATEKLSSGKTRFFDAPGQAGKAYRKLRDSIANLNKLRRSLGLTTPEFSGVKSSLAAEKARNLAFKKAGSVSKPFVAKFKQLLNPDIGLKLTIQDAVRYQPVPALGTLGQSKFVNVFGFDGMLNAFGVPVKLAFSTDRAASMPNGGAYNDLFKFDFDPQALKASLKSDLQQYADVKNQFLGGKDIGAFAKSKLNEKLYDQTTGFKSALGNKKLADFLNQPGNIEDLMLMDRSQMLKTLKEQAGMPDAAGRLRNALAELQDPTQLKNQLLAQKNEIGIIRNNSVIQDFFNHPGHYDQIRFMTKEQIAEKLTGMRLRDSLQRTGELGNSATDSLLKVKLAGDSTTMRLAQEIFLSARTSGKVDLNRQLSQMDQMLTQRLSTFQALAAGAATGVQDKNLKGFNSIIEVEKVAASLTAVKSEMQSKGLDVDKMIQMQRFLKEGDYRHGVSELGGRLMGRSSGGPLQQLFGNLDALKLGAFSNHVPGATNDQDLFLKGGSVTLRPGRIPVTFGYGSVSDISSVKDAAFQGSVFNEPRNVTYISTELRRSGYSNLKISFVSSVSRQIRNQNYSMPAISNNNVALTISKGLNIGRLGLLDFEASKSSTLYANKYQSPALTALDAKNGARPDFAGDLYNSLAFGFTHRLDMPAVGASDNIYFKYSGVGYQNPGNNGFGGARMKFGGSLRKALYRNKMVLNLRTDFSNMPISYTSDDRWKTFNVQLDSRFTVNRSFSFNLRYANNGTDKRIEGLSSRVYSFQKFQFDGNANYKIGRNYSFSHFSVGTQAVSTPAAGNVAGDGSRLLLFNYVQTMMMKRNVLSFNLLYNRELTPNHLIGNMLNTDLNYQYKLFRKLVLTSGATFFDNSGIARQAGLKQGIQLMSAGHFDIGSYLDVRKNLVKPLYAELYPSCRAEFNVRYHLNAL